MAGLLLLLLLAPLTGLLAAPPPRPVRPSVLYIVVDDLRVELPMYGQKSIQAPHLQQLAARGTVFDRCYCNQPVCSPSRNSFMSGRRPDKTLVWNFQNTFREVGPRWTTLPSHFLQHGYTTLGTGKLYHEGLPANGDGNLSWTDSPVQFSCVDSSAGGAGTYCDPKMASCSNAGPSYAPHPRWCVVPPPDGAPHGDGYFADINTTRDALLKFRSIRAAGANVSFFLGVGLRKPVSGLIVDAGCRCSDSDRCAHPQHLDWRVPQSFVEKYPAESVGLAAHPVAPPGLPEVAYHDVARSPGERKHWEGWGYRGPWAPMRNLTAVDMRRHYYAAVTFMDARVGELLSALDQSGRAEDTIVLFHADHGWALGENGMWRKFQLTELGTRVPLIVSVPWLPQSHGQRSAVITELVDVMPSLSDLAGLPAPRVHRGEAGLDGVSFAQILDGTSNADGEAWADKGWALSVYPRCPTDPIGHGLWYNNWCINVDRTKILYMGYSLRVHGWRYTAWQPWNGTSLSAVAWPESKPLNGTSVTTTANEDNGAGTSLFFEELFAYSDAVGSELDLDTLDVVEVSGQPENAATIARLYAQLREYALDQRYTALIP
jgi:iduronate 2-sulfatase